MPARRLHLSPSLSLPVEFITCASVIYGNRNSGKTTLAAVIVEEVHNADGVEAIYKYRSQASALRAIAAEPKIE